VSQGKGAQCRSYLVLLSFSEGYRRPLTVNTERRGDPIRVKAFLRKILGREVSGIVRESFSNFILVVILTASAIGLSEIKHLCQKANCDPEIIFFVSLLEYTAMITDAGLFLCTCVILTWKRIKRLSK
jgi:hypothetical protein